MKTEEAIVEEIFNEIKRCGMCETTYITKKCNLTIGEAVKYLKRLEREGKVRFVPCGKWFLNA